MPWVRRATTRPSSYADSTNSPSSAASDATRDASDLSTPRPIISRTVPRSPRWRDRQYLTMDRAYCSSSIRPDRISPFTTSAIVEPAYPLRSSRSNISPDERGAASSRHNAASRHASASCGFSGPSPRVPREPNPPRRGTVLFRLRPRTGRPWSESSSATASVPSMADAAGPAGSTA